MDFPTQKRLLSPILNHASNHICADCDTRTPTWASLDYGVFLCSNCSGAHRALGPTYTRVKSVNLDLWKDEWFQCMVLGNQQLNAYWEADPACHANKPKMGASPEEIRRYVVQKYVKKRYVQDPSEDHPLKIFKMKQSQKQEPPQKLNEDAVVQKDQRYEEIKQPEQVQQRKAGQKEQLLLLEFNTQPQPAVQPISQQAHLSNVTVHTEHATSFTSETSKENFMDFNTLLQNHRQNAASSQLHHSLSSQAVFSHHPPYPPQLQQPFVHQNYMQHPYPPLGHHSPPSHPSFNTDSVPLQSHYRN